MHYCRRRALQIVATAAYFAPSHSIVEPGQGTTGAVSWSLPHDRPFRWHPLTTSRDDYDAAQVPSLIVVATRHVPHHALTAQPLDTLTNGLEWA